MVFKKVKLFLNLVEMNKMTCSIDEYLVCNELRFSLLWGIIYWRKMTSAESKIRDLHRTLFPFLHVKMLKRFFEKVSINSFFKIIIRNPVELLGYWTYDVVVQNSQKFEKPKLSIKNSRFSVNHHAPFARNQQKSWLIREKKSHLMEFSKFPCVLMRNALYQKVIKIFGNEQCSFPTWNLSKVFIGILRFR